MSADGATAAPRKPVAHPGRAVALTAAVGLATIVAIVAGEGRPEIALAPVGVAAVLYGLARLPLRYPAAALLFATLAIDCSTDADFGLWTTPLAFLGDILRDNLDRAVGLPGVKLSGLEAAIVALLGLSLWRRVTGSPLEERDRGVGCPLIRDVVLVYVAALGYAVVNGILRGGSFQLWQVRLLLQIPFLFFFFQLAFPRKDDLVLVAWVVIAATLVKAALSIWVARMVFHPDGSKVAYTTNHGDSILFTVGILILLSAAIEGFGKRGLWRTGGLVAFIAYGMVGNNRRLGWVQLALSLGAVYVLTAWRPWKRMVAQAAVVAVPVLALYAAAGWNSNSGVFKPARMLRSLVDQKSDASTLWRDVENWNIATTMRQAPVMGIGLGQQYVEHMQNDDISSIYPEFRYWPHNSVLGLLLFAGVFGFAGMWILYATVIFLAIRAYRLSIEPQDRVATMGAIVTILVCIVQAYGDIGAPFIQYRVFVALALTVTWRLAMETGAWGSVGQGTGAGAPPGTALWRRRRAR